MKGLRLAACDRLALARGLKVGERLADARARVPDLASVLHEPERDAAMLLRLARWAERWSPAVMPDPPDGLLLDATGVAHLFGGEAMLLADIKGQCARLAFTAVAALAGTPAAARALARFSRLMILAPGNERGGLGPLPVEALGVDGETCHTLRRLGFKTIGDVCRLPRASLARRFRGEAGHVLKALDAALGLTDTPLHPLSPEPHLVVRHCVMDPIVTAEGIEAVVTLLSQTLSARLADAGRGALRVVLKLYRTDASRAVVPAGLARPSRDPRHLARLTAPRLAGIDLGFGVDAATLEAAATAPLDYRQDDLDGTPAAAGIELAHLADRIANRPDGAPLTAFEAVASHLPERAERQVAPGFGEAAQAPFPPPADGPPGAAPRRPVVLFDRPEEASVIATVPDGPPVRFTWRRLSRRVVRAEGPERIAPEWWRLPPDAPPVAVRDYYVVEDEEGRRYWLYREGLYGEAPGASPRWFVHGLFA